MVKFHLKRLVLPISLIFLSAGCSYKIIGGGERAVYIMPVENSTLNPQLDIYMSEELSRVFIRNPRFILAGPDKDNSIALKIKIEETDRQSLFYSSEEPPRTVIAGISVVAEVELIRKGESVLKEKLSESAAFPLTVAYNEEEVLKSLSEKLANKVYFWLLDKDEKGEF